MRIAADRLRADSARLTGASKPGHEPAIGVGRRRGEREDRRRMLQQPAGGVQAHLAQAGVAVAREERLAALPERRVRVHAAAVVLEDRLRHERHRLAVALRDVLADVLYHMN